MNHDESPVVRGEDANHGETAPVRGEDANHGEAAPVRDESTAGQGEIAAKPAAAVADTTGGGAARPGRWRGRRLPGPAVRWLSIFSISLALLLVRFLVPTAVGQADNRDGPRLLCGFGLGPVFPRGYPRFFRYAYFQYAHSAACGHRLPYPSSELVPLVLARLLTPVFGLPGTLNLIALGILFCLLASAGIASLATGLRRRLWVQLVVAAVAWLIIADAAFFDVFASPFSEPATLVGLLLVAAGLLYLGRGWRSTLAGLVLAGSGGFLAILSKEQYLVLVVPICIALVLAAADRRHGRGLRRFRTREANAAVTVAVLLATLTAALWAFDYTSHYGQRLQHIQAVDMIFTNIVTRRATAPAELRALGLPVSWAKYAGHYYWHPDSVRTDPLYARYEGKLTDLNLLSFLVTHPHYIASIGQQSAEYAQQIRVNTLGDYPPNSGHPKGAVESRLVAFTWLVHRLPLWLGLLLYLPLWAAMAALAVVALRRRRREAWHRSAAILVLCMTGCALVAFIPPAYFAGISTTRHMVGTNLATALALLVTLVLAGSLAYQALTRNRRGPQTPAAAPPEQPAPSKASASLDISL